MAHPTEPEPEVGMISGRNQAWVVEAGGGHVQVGIIAIEAECQLHPTARAKFLGALC
jgi:hypothetical protein